MENIHTTGKSTLLKKGWSPDKLMYVITERIKNLALIASWSWANH